MKTNMIKRNWICFDFKICVFFFSNLIGLSSPAMLCRSQFTIDSTLYIPENRWLSSYVCEDAKHYKCVADDCSHLLLACTTSLFNDSKSNQNLHYN